MFTDEAIEQLNKRISEGEYFTLSENEYNYTVAFPHRGNHIIREYVIPKKVHSYSVMETSPTVGTNMVILQLTPANAKNLQYSLRELKAIKLLQGN